MGPFRLQPRVITHLAAAASWPMSLLSCMPAPLLPSAAAAAALPWPSLAPESKLLSCFMTAPDPAHRRLSTYAMSWSSLWSAYAMLGAQKTSTRYLCATANPNERETIHPTTTKLLPQLIPTSVSLPAQQQPCNKYKHQQQPNSSKGTQPAHTEALSQWGGSRQGTMQILTGCRGS